MKILVFHQPFPMGNYLLNQVVANHLQSQGHEVYVLEQLNGRPCTPEYMQQILDADFDVCYFEMLDHETFKIVERLKCKRILLFASAGVLGEYDKILNYHSVWYDMILTNSLQMYKKFVKHGIEAEHFEFYHSVINTPQPPSTKSMYEHDCVFLGMGFNRLKDSQYQLERDLYFSSDKISLFGNGWPQMSNYYGVLPPDDIGSLYSSARSAIGIIAKAQREHGMINNRYTEIASCACPLISYNYDNIDWFGAEKFINFVSSKLEVETLIADIQERPDEYKQRALDFQSFIRAKDTEFFQKLNKMVAL